MFHFKVLESFRNQVKFTTSLLGGLLNTHGRLPPLRKIYVHNLIVIYAGENLAIFVLNFTDQR